MKFRHEWKYNINIADLITLRARLPLLMQHDAHTSDGVYRIRSLYFDNQNDQALLEKQDGVNYREKFRIRYYNDDLSYIMLEKKSKINGLCHKESIQISREEAQKIANGDIEWMAPVGAMQSSLLQEFYAKIKYLGLQPKTIVDYTREAFVYAPGNVRITLDYDIRTGDFRTDFLNTETWTMPAGDAPLILEVKWDEFLPDMIRDAVFLPCRHVSAFSKYEQCRVYG